MSYYWKRRNETLKEIKKGLEDDNAYKKRIEEVYSNAQRDIQKEINNELMRYAGSENLSLSAAQKKIDSVDVEAFRNKLNTYKSDKDLSQRAQDELKAFNVQTRMNRNQLLLHNIQLDTIALADKEDKMLTDKLVKDIGDKYKSMTDRLGETVPEPDELNRLATALVEADYKGTNFSNRIWANQKELQSGLERSIERTMIQGKNPTEGARDLMGLVKKEFSNKRYAAERIAITETARVQDQAQRASFDKYGVEEFEWIAEPDACDECSGYDGNIYKVNDPSTPSVPAHPFCRCSVAPYIDRDTVFDEIREERETGDAWEAQREEMLGRMGEFKEQKSIAGANKYAVEKLGLRDAGYNGLDPIVANQMNQSIHEHIVDFPELQNQLKFSGTMQERNSRMREDLRKSEYQELLKNNPRISEGRLRDAAASNVRTMTADLTPRKNSRAQSLFSQTDVVRDYNGITTNARTKQSAKSIEKGLKLESMSKWVPKGVTNMKGITDHELGHQLDNMLGISDIDEIKELFDTRTHEEIKNELSEYSFNNNNPNDYSEMIAEGWAEYRNNPKPRPMANKIGKTIENEYKKQKLKQ